MTKESCFCGSTQPFQDCCEPFLLGKKLPTTAGQLMRSRYSAYVTRNESYLLTTWHASTRPNSLHLGNVDGTKWLGLKITDVLKGSENDTHGEVEFVARYAKNGRATRLHERSRFVKEGEQWFYVDGIVD